MHLAIECCRWVQAANAFSIAESNAMGAANHARIEQTMASLAAAMAAISAFDQVPYDVYNRAKLRPAPSGRR